MISKYQVIKVLGRGGMGEVLLAQDDLTGRRVAIKRPFASAAADGLARFKVEARAATLTHPNIPVVYEMGTQDDGLPFIAMEFVEGEPLDKLLAAGKPTELMEKLSIVEQVCAGLGYAHEKNIIHRDIKPANIIVQANGVAKIIDFGIAKITNVEVTSELTQASQIIGSLHYIAPERFKAEAIDGRVDIFSAGVILYQLLTGTLPFAGGEATASYRIVNEAHSKVSSYAKDYPKALDAIVDRALAKNPEDRYSTAEDFADALREVIDDLKRAKVSRLFNDAERLTMENRYDPALDLLNEAMKLDSANTQVRKLRRMVREHQERRRRQDLLREYVIKAESLLAAESYAEALSQLKEAYRVDATSTELRDRIAFVEEKKNRYEKSAATLAEIEKAQARGDITGALRLAEGAVQFDPDNTRLLAARGAMAKQLEREAAQAKVLAILDSAEVEFARKNFTAVDALLADAAAIDSSHHKIEEMRAELARLRELEERRKLMDEIQRRVNDFLRGDDYEKASDLLNRAIDKLPSETTLHRLKMDVDTAARKFDSQRFIEGAISSARQTFATDPQRALLNLQKAIEQLPGEERLISYERTLHLQYDTQLKQQLLSNTLRNARQFLANNQPQRAIDALEAYQLEHGGQADVDELLGLARQEQRAQERRGLIEKNSLNVRALIREERLDEAAALLDSALKMPAVRDSGDKTLANLLEDVRRQQQAATQKLDATRKRATALQQRGQLDEAIQVLTEYLAGTPHSAPIQELLASLRAESEIKQVTAQAIGAAAQAAQQGNFGAAFEALQAVVRAYGDSEDLTRANQQVQAARAAYAQEVVSQSITTSRAALLRNDVPGALDALRTANEMLEFADAAKQADWRRIAQAAKKAQSEPMAEGAVIADPLADLADAAAERKSTSPVVVISGIVAMCVVLAVAGVMIFRKPAPVTGPAAATDAHLSIAKAPPGALVSIDNGARQPTDTTGALTVKVAPGQHLLDVTMEGFDPYTEKFQVQPGETYREAVSLTKQPLASKAGTLSMQSNLPGFKVFVDGRARGEIMKKEGTLTLEEGEHTVRYTNEDGSDSVAEHKIVIAAGKATPDAIALKAPAPVAVSTGGITVLTTANAQISIDGRSRGAADGSGKLTINSLPAGNHSIDISLDKYQPINGRSVAVTANQIARVDQPLTALVAQPPPPSTGSLSISTNAGAQVLLNGQRKGAADGSGQLNLDGLAPGSYQLDITLDQFLPKNQSITIQTGRNNVLAKLDLKPQPAPKPVETTPAVDTAAEAKKFADAQHGKDVQGIKEALNTFVQAYRSKNMAGIEANWQNMGAARQKSTKGLFDIADVVNLSETCQGDPVILGDSATQNCTESYQYVKSDPVKKSPKTITFSKVNGKWVMKDKVP